MPEDEIVLPCRRTSMDEEAYLAIGAADANL